MIMFIRLWPFIKIYHLQLENANKKDVPTKKKEIENIIK